MFTGFSQHAIAVAVVTVCWSYEVRIDRTLTILCTHAYTHNLTIVQTTVQKYIEMPKCENRAKTAQTNINMPARESP